MLRRLGLLLVSLIGLVCQPALADSKIFVASSLADVVEALVEASSIEGIQVIVGSSSSLARQIKSGAPADLYISANKDWAQFVAVDEKLQPLFSNRLVLISYDAQKLGDVEKLAELLGSHRLALGDPDHVPAGIYAREALEKLRLWDNVRQQLAPADNVRAAARLVQTGAAPFGIVYRSDAELLTLNIAFEFDAETHSPINYWMVQLREDQSDIVRFVSFLGSAEARDIVASYGFLPLEGQ